MGVLSDMDNITWEWVGRGVVDPDSDRIMYKKARVTLKSNGKKRLFSVGDAIYVSNGDEGADWVGQVVQLFQRASHSVADEVEVVDDTNAVLSMRCTLRWLYSENDIEDKSYAANRSVESPLAEELYYSDHVELAGTNALEVIEGRAWLCTTPSELKAKKRNPPPGYWKGDPIRLVRYFVGRIGDPKPIRELAKGELEHFLRNPSVNQNLYNTGQRTLFGLTAAMKGTGSKKYGGTHRLVRGDASPTSPIKTPPKTEPDSPEHDWRGSPGGRGTRKSTRRPRRIIHDSLSDEEEEEEAVLRGQSSTAAAINSDPVVSSGPTSKNEPTPKNGLAPSNVAPTPNGSDPSARQHKQAVTSDRPKSTDPGGPASSSQAKKGDNKRQAADLEQLEDFVPIGNMGQKLHNHAHRRRQSGGSSANPQPGSRADARGSMGRRDRGGRGPPNPPAAQWRSRQTADDFTNSQGRRSSAPGPGSHVGQGRIIEVPEAGNRGRAGDAADVAGRNEAGRHARDMDVNARNSRVVATGAMRRRETVIKSGNIHEGASGEQGSHRRRNSGNDYNSARRQYGGEPGRRFSEANGDEANWRGERHAGRHARTVDENAANVPVEAQANVIMEETVLDSGVIGRRASEGQGSSRRRVPADAYSATRREYGEEPDQAFVDEDGFATANTANTGNEADGYNGDETGNAERVVDGMEIVVASGNFGWGETVEATGTAWRTGTVETVETVEASGIVGGNGSLDARSTAGVERNVVAPSSAAHAASASELGRAQNGVASSGRGASGRQAEDEYEDEYEDEDEEESDGRRIARLVHREDESGLVAMLARMPSEEAADMQRLMPIFGRHMLDVMTERGITFDMSEREVQEVSRLAMGRMRSGS